MSGQPDIAEPGQVFLQFEDNSLLAMLFGEHDRHLARIEADLGVSVVSRGNRLAISGAPAQTRLAERAFNMLYDRLRRGLAVASADVDSVLKRVSLDSDPPVDADVAIRTRKRLIVPRTPVQAAYVAAMRQHDLVFGLGPAGTGKTYLAVAVGVQMMMAGEVDRIILSRPAVEAGERLGFLPGDLKEKVDPYLRPLYDALHDMLPADQVIRRLGNGEIEVAPLAFMRGRTLAHAFVILDEAQNTTPTQMKMFLTRLGDGSRMVVTGDMSQIDLPMGVRSGLHVALEVLDGVEGVAAIRFTDRDVVRHAMVARIVRAYDRYEARNPPMGARPEK
jgi:phosphate starvation-inducible protein PhoH and related proteins